MTEEEAREREGRTPAVGVIVGPFHRQQRNRLPLGRRLHYTHNPQV